MCTDPEARRGERDEHRGVLSDRVGDALAAADEPWTVYVIEVRQVPATPDHAAVLGLDVGDTLAERHYQVAGAHSKQPWGIGLSP